MKCSIVIPEITWRRLYGHLFQNELEQGAFVSQSMVDFRVSTAVGLNG